MRNGYFRPAVQLAQMLLCVVQYPFLARQTLNALSRNHALRQKVLTLATTLRAEGFLNGKDRLHLLLGI